MKPRLRHALATLGALVVVAGFVLSGREIVSRQRTFDEINGLRERLYDARSEAQACQRALAARQRDFRRLNETVDSLRTAVSGFEGLDDRGVPQEQYDAYLETFDHYNDSVDAWEGRADALQAAESACRAMVVRHNALRDSLERRLAEEGISGN